MDQAVWHTVMEVISCGPAITIQEGYAGRAEDNTGIKKPTIGLCWAMERLDETKARETMEKGGQRGTLWKNRTTMLMRELVKGKQRVGQ